MRMCQCNDKSPANVFLHLSPSTFAENPKSVSLTAPSRPSKMLSDLMSLSNIQSVGRN